MQKPLLSAEIIEEGPDRFSDHSSGQQNSLEHATTSRKRSRPQRRFNPSVVGFGILENPKNANDNSAHTDEAVSRVARRRSESLKEGK
jgi:hypothetical protein